MPVTVSVSGPALCVMVTLTYIDNATGVLLTLSLGDQGT